MAIILCLIYTTFEVIIFSHWLSVQGQDSYKHRKQRKWHPLFQHYIIIIYNYRSRCHKAICLVRSISLHSIQLCTKVRFQNRNSQELLSPKSSKSKPSRDLHIFSFCGGRESAFVPTNAMIFLVGLLIYVVFLEL